MGDGQLSFNVVDSLWVTPTAVYSKMAVNELVREGVVVMCDYLMKECQHILEKRNKRKKRRSGK
jgi:hypothetical protein